MSEFITELLKRKMIPFGVINGRRKSLSKFNPYHDELGRFTSGPSGNKAQSYRMSHQPDVESDSVRFYELDRAMPNF